MVCLVVLTMVWIKKLNRDHCHRYLCLVFNPSKDIAQVKFIISHRQYLGNYLGVCGQFSCPPIVGKSLGLYALVTGPTIYMLCMPPSTRDGRAAFSDATVNEGR